MIPAEALAWGVFIFIAVAFSIANYYDSRRRGGHDLDESLGAIGRIEVGIALDGGRRFVELKVPHESGDATMDMHAHLTANQAKRLAELLRSAATPGRTLDDARDRSRKAA